jgi:Peptidase A4 family
VSRSSIIRGALVGIAAVLIAPSAAFADASLSTNWAGYAVHRAGVSFRDARATWKQPAAECNPPNPTYEASWVGIGGYNRDSNALEQIGTELDCNASGAARSAAWYEVVPAPSRRIGMTIRPGDTLSASVTVVGRRVTLRIADRTRRESFSKHLTVAAVDVRSAEWIVEAPSGCFSDNSCRTLPLTNFGTESFSAASATTARGRHGSIASSLWGRSKITLAPVGRTLISSGSAARAAPSPLSQNGSSFLVTYGRAVSAAVRAVFAPRAAAGAGAVEPGGHRR